ncbi:glycoside hydrolase family 43 protein [Companilactobacillus alimentarius]|uniref:glycoside hydrolase family 43 protein n=1 Tax=Companilactobacillus alimentarius TaxID=1602 RepID=UPI0028BBA23A|nr:family 43 glycosylhydrolase [Companilactobacillus alimentarius]MDT6952246.1 family 43 glycosylhydrolase [Companilactobacillus alimentarius]
MQYKNPILRGMRPDPSIVRVDKYYYMVNSTFEYYPGITLARSTDLLNWKTLPSVATKHSQADLTRSKSNEGIFAVCIRYHNDKFYVITTNFVEFKTFIITGSLNSDGKIVWDDQRININVNGIDPDIFFDGDHTYVQYTGYLENGQKALQQVEIELTSGRILDGPKILTYGTGGRDVEGPHIIKKSNYYYLLAAEGGTGLGHMITIFRSKNIWGPFEECPDNPIFSNRDRADEAIQNIGHGDLFQDESKNWWLVCLGTRPININFKTFTNTGRETMLYPVDWSSDWPIINNGLPSDTVDMTKFPEHAKTLQNQKFTDFTDFFKKGNLNPEWVSLRNSLADRLKIEPNNLTLTGSDLTLSDIDTPSFLGLRQTEPDETFTVDVNADNCNLTTGQIGVAVTIDSTHFASLTIKKNENGHFDLIKTIHVFDLVVEEKVAEITEFPKQFSIINHPSNKEFLVQTADNDSLGFKVAAMHFSNEAISALNTGDMLGIYALGNDSKISIKKAHRFLINKEEN